MKISKLIFPVLALGLIGSAGTAIAMRGSAAKQASAYGAGDYTPSNDHFVACFNGNNALRDAYNGDDENRDSTRADNVTISGMDPTSSISWKVSCAKYSYDTFRNLKLGNKTKTIENSADEEFAAIYSALGIESGHYVNALYSTTRIYNIQDFSLTWGSSDGNLSESKGYLYFLYKVDGGSWTPIQYKTNNSRIYYSAIYGTDDPLGDNVTWNSHRANIKLEYMNYSNILGKTAQIAIAYDAGTKNTGSNINFICLHSLVVNRVSSAKATLHYWDKTGDEVGVCYNISNSAANTTVQLAIFTKSIEQLQVDGGTYGGKTIDGLNETANFEYNKAKETTYYNQLAYLCGLAGISIGKTPSVSSQVLFFDGKNNDNLVIASVVIASAATIITTLFFLLKKKRYN